VAREIQRAPCNGWERWFYMDEVSGERLVIDTLREKYLEETANRNKE